VLALLAACSAPHGAALAPRTDLAQAEPVPWRYEVRYAGGDLRVEARFAPGVTGVPRVDDDAAPFVRDLTTSSEGAWRVLRYRFALREAAERLMDVETATVSGGVYVAPPSTWLLHPDPPSTGDFRVHVSVDPPDRFVAGTHPSADGAADTYQAAAADLDSASFSAFGPLHVQSVTSGASRLVVASAPEGLPLGDADVATWARMATDGIGGYLRRDFPVPRTLLAIVRGKPGPTRGETMGDGGPAVLIRTGDGVTAATTRDDWVLTHELLHVVLPSLSHEHVWLSEGIPSYVEPLARVRLGTLRRETMWHDLVEGMPQGLPEAGDEGLEKTHTWGRTYWGGALFCLVADVRIREKTANARSFDDVVRAVVATGANVESHWEIGRILDVGDAATGTSVLHDLYAEMALAPGTISLPDLWRRLGVTVRGADVSLDETAPLAAVRRGMETR
jgi:hypothetical protein